MRASQQICAHHHPEIVLEEVSESARTRHSVRIPHEKIHQVTVWMRRIAAEFEGVRIPE